jgi:hypothetical protein
MKNKSSRKAMANRIGKRKGKKNSIYRISRMIAEKAAK